jgi:hypothetical protein
MRDVVETARRTWRYRAPENGSGGSRMVSLQVEMAPLDGFFRVVREVSAAARARGEIGEGDAPVWSLEEWQRFVDAARAERHLGALGTAIFRTVTNVQQMVRDGRDARFIHAALYWRSRKDDSEHEKKLALERAEEARKAARDRALAVAAQKEIELVRLEARERAKAEVESRRESGSQRRRRGADEPI